MMRKLLYFLIIFLSCGSAFAQFTDDFSDGDFNQNPPWLGNNNKYTVNNLQMLQLNAPAEAAVSYLSTPSFAINNAVWEFYIEMDFNPSGSNFAKVYLVSDKDNLTSSLSGYFIKAGGSNDEISLYRQDGMTETEISLTGKVTGLIFLLLKLR